MTMGHEDGHDVLALDRCSECFTMTVEIRSGVDNGDVATPDDVRARSVIGELGRVLGDDSPDPRNDLDRFAVFERLGIEA